jgi:hypothetical protein
MWWRALDLTGSSWGPVAGCFKQGSEYTGCIKDGEFCYHHGEVSGSCSVGN